MKIYEWSISTWKDDQHNLLPEKCKVKSHFYCRMGSVEQLEILCIAVHMNAMWNGITTLIVWQLFKKLNIHEPYKPAFPFLVIYRREMITYAHTKICTWMFIAISFVIIKPGNNPSVNNRCIDKQTASTQILDYCLAVKRNTLLIHVALWVNLKRKLHLKPGKVYILYNSIYIQFQKTQMNL